MILNRELIMKIKHVKAGLGIFVLSITMSSWAASQCSSIAMSCMKLGYYKGGDDVGKGLIKDCVIPVTEKTKIIPNMTFTDAQLSGCKADIASKMKNH